MKFQINRKRHSGGIILRWMERVVWWKGRPTRDRHKHKASYVIIWIQSNRQRRRQDVPRYDSVVIMFYRFLSLLGKDRQSLPHPSGGRSVVYLTTRVSISFRPPFGGVVSIKKMLSWAAVQGMRFPGRIRKPIPEIMPKGYFICKKKKDMRYTSSSTNTHATTHTIQDQ